MCSRNGLTFDDLDPRIISAFTWPTAGPFPGGESECMKNGLRNGPLYQNKSDQKVCPIHHSAHLLILKTSPLPFNLCILFLISLKKNCYSKVYMAIPFSPRFLCMNHVPLCNENCQISGKIIGSLIWNLRHPRNFFSISSWPDGFYAGVLRALRVLGGRPIGVILESAYGTFLR